MLTANMLLLLVISVNERLLRSIRRVGDGAFTVPRSVNDGDMARRWRERYREEMAVIT